MKVFLAALILCVLGGCYADMPHMQQRNLGQQHDVGETQGRMAALLPQGEMRARPVDHPTEWLVTWSRHTPQAASIPTQITLRCGQWERVVTLPLDVMSGTEWSPCVPEIDAPVGLGVHVTVEVQR